MKVSVVQEASFGFEVFILKMWFMQGIMFYKYFILTTYTFTPIHIYTYTCIYL